VSTQYGTLPEKTVKPVVAGVFNICNGASCLLGVLILLIFGIVIIAVGEEVPVILGIILLLCSIPLTIIGALSIAGGIFSIRRRLFGLALAGSIASTLVSTLLGVASIVLIAVSKNEFES
jgi:hypothetical protein